MIKNRQLRFKPILLYNENGNWNFRNPSLNPVYTKPISEVKIDNDIFVFDHQDIFDLISFYHKADKKSIEMIKNSQAGEIKSFETPLLEKIKQHLKFLEEEDKAIKQNPYNKNQMCLK